MSGIFSRLVPCVLAWLSLSVAGAGVGVAAPAKHYVSVDTGSAVVKVHRRHHHGRSHIVDAPYTHVESGRHVAVDAPFTTVYVGRRGRYVRAPFVELWLPR
jgi:hypothetical protein